MPLQRNCYQDCRLCAPAGALISDQAVLLVSMPTPAANPGCSLENDRSLPPRERQPAPDPLIRKPDQAQALDETALSWG